MKTIDLLINVLKHAKNCDKALHNLKRASENMIFDEELFNEYMKNPEDSMKARQFVKSLILESIKIIEEDDEISEWVDDDR